MSFVTMRFRGLCAFLQREDHCDVALLGGGSHGHHGRNHQHEATLVARLRHVDLPKMSWTPDSIVDDGNGEQMGVWKIPADTHDISVVSTAPGPGAIDWHDRNHSVDLQLFHPGATSMTRDAIEKLPGVSLIRLGDGDISCSHSRTYELLKHGARIAIGTFATTITWKGAASAIRREAGALDIPFKGDAEVGVTNIARISDATGLTHFTHYYELCTLAPGDAPLELRGMSLDEEVFDCVPPVPEPPEGG